MVHENDNQREVLSWLKVALAEEELENLSAEITEGSAKGDGFLGDIVFVVATGTDKKGSTKEYNLVLKCSKSSAVLMEKTPAAKEVFVRESYLYEKIFPAFRQFQLDQGIIKPFDSVAKCYGIYRDEIRHILVMENLKKKGYDLWNNRTPLTRKHIDLVIREYGKFHATSVAFSEQHPEIFQGLTREIVDDMFVKFLETDDFVLVNEKAVEEVCEILKDHLCENILKKWFSLKDKVRHICTEMGPEDDDLKIVIHGDCWSNNFLYKYADEEKTDVSHVAMLDWQLSSLSTPIKDLSYFLFACISEKDLSDMKTILKEYYNTFTEYLTRFGSDFASRYTFEKFLEEWKKFGKFGLVWCLMPLKLSYTEKSNLPDIGECADNEQDLGEAFFFKPTYFDDYKKRISPIVKYGVENDLV